MVYDSTCRNKQLISELLFVVFLARKLKIFPVINPYVDGLILCGLVTPYDDIDPSQH